MRQPCPPVADGQPPGVRRPALAAVHPPPWFWEVPFLLLASPELVPVSVVVAPYLWPDWFGVVRNKPVAATWPSWPSTAVTMVDAIFRIRAANVRVTRWQLPVACPLAFVG